MRALWALSRAMWKQLIHDRAALFFYFLFPLMFLVLFGLLFGNPGAGKVSVGVVGHGTLLDDLPSEILNIEHFDDYSEALDEVSSGSLPAVVRIEGDVVKIDFSETKQVSSATVIGAVQSVVNKQNLDVAGVEPRFSVDSTRVEKDSYEPVQFLTSGLLSWGVAMSAAFGAALNLVAWRKNQVLRRMRLAPVSPIVIVAARVAVGLVVALAQAALFIGVAMTPPFGLQLGGSWWLMVPVLVAGTLAFMSIGLLVGSVTKSQEAASGAVNLIVLPMAFLSGAFFEVSEMPELLQKISWVFPMRHLNAALLDVLVRDSGWSDIVVPTLVLFAFAAVFTALGAKFFSWED